MIFLLLRRFRISERDDTGKDAKDTNSYCDHKAGSDQIPEGTLFCKRDQEDFQVSWGISSIVDSSSYSSACIYSMEAHNNQGSF